MFFRKMNKPKIGYQKINRKRKFLNRGKSDKWLANLFISPIKKITFSERLVKFLIYVALGIVIWGKKWRDKEKNHEIIDRVYKRIISKDFSYIPSSLSFFLIVAVIPILSIILFSTSIKPLNDFLFSLEDIKPILSKFIPGLNVFINDIVNAINHVGENYAWTTIFSSVISLILTSWIASSGFSSLIYMQSHIFGHKYYGGYWMNKIKGTIIVLMASFYFILVLTINVKMSDLIDSFNISQIGKSVLLYFFLIIGLFILLFCGFLLLFKFSPRFKIKFRNVVPGAMVATIPTFLFLSLFGIISSFWNYGKFGTLGVFLYISTSMLIISYFLYMGILTNASYYKTFVSSKVKRKFTISKK